MTTREKAGAWIGATLTMAVTGYSAWKLIGTGVLSWHIRQPEFAAMMIELLVVWVLLFLLFFCGTRKWIRLAGILGITVLFSWLHVVFLPVLFGGLYLAYLILVGRFIAQTWIKRKLGIAWEFMLGTAVTITVFCLLSLMQRGSIEILRWFVIGSGALLIFWHMRGVTPPCVLTQKAEVRRGSVLAAMMLAAIVTLLFLQMGRMNIAVDFDSLWYGTRSATMLNSGNSIYENLGTLGVVYTYPKGWEVVTLPLAGLPSYSFPIAFNIWITGLTLFVAYETACVRMSKKSALWVPFLMAAVPAIMNMGGTAKADILTLLFQLLMIQAMLQYEKERQTDWLIMGLAAGAISLTMKPTAVVFSTAIVGMGIIWLLWDKFNRRNAQKHEETNRCRSHCWLILLPSLTALVGIWGRTLKLVGVPVTSVFYQLFQRIGFQVNYPFYASGFPSAGSKMTLMEQAQFFGGRLYGVLLNPQGEDMGHVIIAWGTVIPLVLFLVWLVFTLILPKQKEGHKRKVPEFLTLLIPAVLMVNLISLYSLTQIDGNYYMLFYALVILASGIWISQREGSLQRIIKGMILPSWLFAVMICGLTNWGWALGMGPLQPLNRGYYNHIQEAREARGRQGSQAIWDLLAANPKNRVIAIGEHPDVLAFPCNVQSYVDVSGYWGNPEVVSSAPEFLRYLQYANIDYLYMEKEYVDTSVRIYQIVRTLIEDGWLYDIRDEHGNLMLAVQKGKPDLGAIRDNLDIFDHRYIQHP